MNRLLANAHGLSLRGKYKFIIHQLSGADRVRRLYRITNPACGSSPSSIDCTALLSPAPNGQT